VRPVGQPALAADPAGGNRGLGLAGRLRIRDASGCSLGDGVAVGRLAAGPALGDRVAGGRGACGGLPAGGGVAGGLRAACSALGDGIAVGWGVPDIVVGLHVGHVLVVGLLQQVGAVVVLAGEAVEEAVPLGSAGDDARLAGLAFPRGEGGGGAAGGARQHAQDIGPAEVVVG
jgi:hypothetical protein